MKNLKYLSILLIYLITGCELAQQPFDSISESDLYSSEANVEAVTKGQYANVKDKITIRGSKYWWSAVPRAYEIFTIQGDDAMYGQNSGAADIFGGDTFNQPINGEFNQVCYTVTYRNIGVCNNVIDNVIPTSDKMKALVAENHFLRAMWYLNAIRLYAKPYTLGRDNPGLPLRLHAGSENMPRATVGEVFDQIVKDLKASETNLPYISSVVDHGRASKEASWAYLSRVYVWMTDPNMATAQDVDFANQAIAYATKVLNSGNVGLAPTAQYFGSEKLRDLKTRPGTPINHYYANAKSSKETLLCIARTDIEGTGKQDRGALWIDDGLGHGWGQIYATKYYRALLDKYPEDLRHNFIEPLYVRDAQGNPLKNPDGSYQVELFRNNKYAPQYFVNKFSYQAGQLTLASEVYMRVGEVMLNRAEAYAKLADDGKAPADGKDAKTAAIADVNTIRARAGLSGNALFSVGDLKGYSSFLDVVIDERKLELAWDLNRSVDLFRNKHSLTDMSYGGVEITIPYDDPRVAYRIPQIELDLNPLLVPNQK